MGTTLHAIVEYYVPPRPRLRGRWKDVCSWEFEKNYELSGAINELEGVHRGWPSTREPGSGYVDVRTGEDGGGPPVRPHDDPHVSSARLDVDEQDIAHSRRWVSLPVLRDLPPPSSRDESYAFRGHFEAMMAACEVLARLHGEERVRVLFYSV